MNFNMPNMQEALRRLQSNPREFLQRAGVNVPDEMLNNPQAMVMHLMQTGQMNNNPMMQRAMQMMRQLTGK